MSLAPIALFAYNRPEHTRRTMAALAHNELAPQSELFIYSDGPKSPADAPHVKAVRDDLDAVTGFKSVTIIRQSRNLGLADSIVSGVTELCQRYDRVIVVEDDLVTSPFFLRYMNGALRLYEHTPEVVCIHGYLLPVLASLPETFFLRGADCWGWATWQRGWKLFNPDGRALLAQLEARQLTRAFDFNGTYDYTAMLRDHIAGRKDSWAIRWYASAFVQDKLTLYPGRSLVQNIGLDSSGTHCGDTTQYDVPVSNQPIELRLLPLRENSEARLAFERHFASLNPPAPTLWERVTGKARGWFGA